MSTAFVCDNDRCGSITDDTRANGWLYISWYATEPATIRHFCSWPCLRRYGKRVNQ